jgi:hypothetical protein
MTTKTYDGQTARLIASVVTCMPSLSSEVMQNWIDNLPALKNFLSGLNPPEVIGMNASALPEGTVIRRVRVDRTRTPDLTPKFQTTFWTRVTARIISYDTTPHHS